MAKRKRTIYDTVRDRVRSFQKQDDLIKEGSAFINFLEKHGAIKNGKFSAKSYKESIKADYGRGVSDKEMTEKARQWLEKEVLIQTATVQGVKRQYAKALKELGKEEFVKIRGKNVEIDLKGLETVKSKSKIPVSEQLKRFWENYKQQVTSVIYESEGL